MSNVTRQQVIKAKPAEKTNKCRKCHKETTGTFNEVTQKCFQCHMEEL